jgi:hypothetical protein
MSKFDIRKLDITKTNDGVDRALRATTNSRHRFLLTAFYRHRFLEMAGRYLELFHPDMMVENPEYNFRYSGIVAKLTGADAVKGLYGHWAQTHQSVFYVENEQIAVADNFIASVAGVAYQQVLGAALIANGLKADDPQAYYLYKSYGTQQIWPYDERGRLVGEDVYEPQADKAEIIKLDPADVLTTEQAAKLLNPMIKPLPSFDETVLGVRQAAA